MGSENSEKVLLVLTKMSENHTTLENRIEAMTEKLHSPQQSSNMITITIIGKNGEEISEVYLTRFEEKEGIAVTKDTQTNKRTDETIEGDGRTGVTSMEVTIVVEIISEATAGKISQITEIMAIMIVS